MFKKIPLPFSLLVLAILITLYTVGSRFSLYWFYPQFDLLLHTLSGLWIALVILWLALCFGQINSLKDFKIKSFLIAFVSAVFVGVMWELLENFFQLVNIYADDYSFNVATDIFTDALGGSLAFLYFVSRKNKIEVASEVIYPFYNQNEIIRN